MNLSYFEPLFTFLELAAQGNAETADIGPEEEAADTLILQEAVAEAIKQEAGEFGDISELFRDSKADEEPEAGTQVPRRARATMRKTFESKPEKQPESERITPIRKKTRAQTSKISKTTTASIAATLVAGMKKQTVSSK